MTVRSLSEMMQPDRVGSTAGCETCGNNDVSTKVTRVAVETLAKLSGKKPAPTRQPAMAAEPPEKQPQAPQRPQGNQPQPQRQPEKK